MENHIKRLAEDIKRKKELQDLDSRFIEYHITRYLHANPKSVPFIEKQTTGKPSKEYKQIIKDLRKVLRRFHGLFQIDSKKGDMQVLFEMLDEIKSFDDLRNVAGQLLSIHASTQERLEIYKQLYHEIFGITGVPSRILDLGCGLNPASIVFMNILEKKCSYYAYDINVKEKQLLARFFEQAHGLYSSFTGKSNYLNLLEVEKIPTLPSVDVTFLFKVTDILDAGKGHKKTEDIITQLKSPFIVLSFPTKTMSGKKMTAPKRNWVTLLCKRLGYTFEVLEYENEIVYIIGK
jgi:hypothetical protein